MDAATTLAVRYRLVTPVSNATVVDNGSHYREVETLFLSAVLFVIALIVTRYRHAGGTAVKP
jgi:hypothetical protein